MFTRKIMLAVSLATMAAQSAEAASCRFGATHLCRGCTETVAAKMRRVDITESKRWCRLAYRTGRDMFRKVVVMKGFDLGELRTGRYSLRFSPLRTGTGTVIYEMHGRAGDTNQPFISRVVMTVQVVEGEFP
ncbi:hypothetical protein [Bosea sp. 124]|uniref:hypothetical protein n=1 Tax=Bosea sp. 124 TaxID=2135642 RepID=UPI000D3BE7F4|nr:hypothetical protein [Bosea sp. 124]PTM41109.1 hypothetical protein C8D03_2643 [Bosea sp. 124]